MDLAARVPHAMELVLLMSQGDCSISNSTHSSGTVDETHPKDEQAQTVVSALWRSPIPISRLLRVIVCPFSEALPEIEFAEDCFHESEGTDFVAAVLCLRPST